MRFATISLLFVIFVFSAFGQQPGPRKNPTNDVVNYALENVQQEGDFYFLPFPHLHWAYGFGLNRRDASKRVGDAQTVLRILVRFEKTRNVEVVTFQLIRDQDTPGSMPMFHGIFLKARKR